MGSVISFPPRRRQPPDPLPSHSSIQITEWEGRYSVDLTWCAPYEANAGKCRCIGVFSEREEALSFARLEAERLGGLPVAGLELAHGIKIKPLSGGFGVLIIPSLPDGINHNLWFGTYRDARDYGDVLRLALGLSLTDECDEGDGER